jgi:tetratricopeptide (TPR) repeat protein
MLEFSVDLSRVFVDATQTLDLRHLDAADAADQIRELYGFLPGALEITVKNGVAAVIVRFEPKRVPDESMRLFGRAVKHAESGKYDQAANLFVAVCKDLPMYRDARRNLGMSLMEAGRMDEAEAALVQSIRLFPDDAWAHLLLANLYAKHRRDLDAAVPLYERVLELTPDDVYALTSYAAALLGQGAREKAKALFVRATEVDSAYPNAYLGLAQVKQGEGDAYGAIATLDALFRQGKTTDIRAGVVFEAAREMYLSLAEMYSKANHERLMELVDGRRIDLENTAERMPVQLVVDRSLTGIQARAESAWHRDGSRHVIRYNDQDQLVIPHLIAHEIEHLMLENEARLAGVNRWFVSTATTRERAIRGMRGDIERLKRRGLPDDVVQQFILSLVDGLANQLFSCPLDMVVEHRVRLALPELAPNQFLSLRATSEKNRQAILGSGASAVAPKRVYEASGAMNAAYAMFIDHLYHGATDYASAYKGAMADRGAELFELWADRIGTLSPGEELDLVDAFARALGLEDWFEWQADPTMQEPPAGATNPELLKAKSMASVWYLVDALKRFAKLETAAVAGIGTEVAMTGRTGLDYASTDKKYTIAAFPGERFTGLQMICFMYAAFQRIDPSLDIGMDLAEEYEMAKKLFGEQF